MTLNPNDIVVVGQSSRSVNEFSTIIRLGDPILDDLDRTHILITQQKRTHNQYNYDISSEENGSLTNVYPMLNEYCIYSMPDLDWYFHRTRHTCTCIYRNLLGYIDISARLRGDMPTLGLFAIFLALDLAGPMKGRVYITGIETKYNSPHIRETMFINKLIKQGKLTELKDLDK